MKRDFCRTGERSRARGVFRIEGNLLDDGLPLRNNAAAEWDAVLGALFEIRAYREIYYPEHEQTNRVYLLRQRA